MGGLAGLLGGKGGAKELFKQVANAAKADASTQLKQAAENVYQQKIAEHQDLKVMDDEALLDPLGMVPFQLSRRFIEFAWHCFPQLETFSERFAKGDRCRPQRGAPRTRGDPQQSGLSSRMTASRRSSTTLRRIS